jgi:ankyrin repeat protein
MFRGTRKPHRYRPGVVGGYDPYDHACLAARQGQLERLNKIIHEQGGGHFLSSSFRNHETPLNAAVQGHQVDIVVRLLGLDIDPNKKVANGRTPLITAVASGFDDLVGVLLDDERVDINAKDSLGRTAVYWAITMGDENSFDLLLARPDMDLSCKTGLGYTLLINAAEMGHVGMVTELLARMSNLDDLTRANFAGDTALSRAIEAGHPVVADLIRARIEALSALLPPPKPKQLTPTEYIALWEEKGHHVKIPDNLLCPLRHNVMDDPVTFSSGATTERAGMAEWFEWKGNPDELECPATRAKNIKKEELKNLSNVAIKGLTQQFIEKQIKKINKAEAPAEEKAEKHKRKDGNRFFEPAEDKRDDTVDIAPHKKSRLKH